MTRYVFPQKPPSKTRRGMTILEIVVACGMFATALLFAVQGAADTYRAARAADLEQRAALLTANVLERLMNLEPADLGQLNDAPGEPATAILAAFPDVAPMIAELNGGALEVNLRTEPDGGYYVRVTTRWNVPVGQRTKRYALAGWSFPTDEKTGGAQP